MKKIICTILFFAFVSFGSLTWAAESDLPLPANAVKTTEQSMNIGPIPSVTQTYETSLNNNDKISAFYSKALARLGWREESRGFFLKDDYMVLIVVFPRKGKDIKTRFSITTSRIPTKEEILAQRKTKPDKLDFMPIYPGSEQVFLWDMPTGLSASYETKSDIKDVVFFYKSGMLNYGWSLSSEAPITTEAVNCPECLKALVQLPKDAIKPVTPDTSSKASLIFRKGSGESCTIRLYQSMDKTTILVTYNANKKINL
ncbi:MAG: hypothetical protein Q7K98_00290 [Candidatus Omnitrophota bacterium]|nr:hypothetical protein [Candidatus Omnitrophota bacterium]